MARLPAFRATVCVGPPLSASGRSRALRSRMSPLEPKPLQPAVWLTRLWPADRKVPPQSGSLPPGPDELPSMIELAMTGGVGPTATPPPGSPPTPSLLDRLAVNRHVAELRGAEKLEPSALGRGLVLCHGGIGHGEVVQRHEASTAGGPGRRGEVAADRGAPDLRRDGRID